MDSSQGPGLSSKTYHLLGFIYGTLGFLLSLLSIIITSTLSTIWPQSPTSQDVISWPKSSSMEKQPNKHELHVHTVRPRPISSSRYRDFHLPPLTPVDEELAYFSDGRIMNRPELGAQMDAQQRPSSDSQIPNSPDSLLFSSEPASDAAEVSSVGDAVQMQGVSHPQPSKTSSGCSSPSRLRRFVSRQSSFHSTHSSHSSDDEQNSKSAEKKKSKQDLCRLCRAKASRHTLFLHNHESIPLTCLRRIKTETSLTDPKSWKGEKSPKQPRPRTQPYDYPYFFPSPASPEAGSYVQILNTERKSRYSQKAPSRNERDPA